MPEYEEVERVFKDSWKSESNVVDARAKLKQWGTAALPHLRVIAEKCSDESAALLLVPAIAAINTKDSAELLVEALEGKTQLKALQVMGLMPAFLRGIQSPSNLFAHPRFKAAVLALDYSKSFLAQQHFAMLAANKGWVEAIPGLRKMLEHKHLSTREAAAKALSALTGEEHQAERPPVHFPHKKLRDGLLGIPQVQNRVPPMRGKVQLRIPGSPEQTVILFSDRRFGRASHVVSMDGNGDELWSFKPQGNFYSADSLATLAGKDGPYGVALGVGGEEGIIALGPNGKVLWDIPKLHVTYSLSAHPQLPELLLQVGGRCKLFEHDASGAGLIDTKGWGPKTRTYAGEAVLFPDELGTPTYIIASSGAEPTVNRFSLNPKERWSAVVSSRICGLTMIDAESLRLFSIVTDAGEVYVFDASGTILATEIIPGLEPGGHSVHGMSARKPKDADNWILDIELSGSPYEIEVHV